MAGGTIWTQKERRYLVRAAKAGDTANDIAEHLGRTVWSVRDKAHRMRVVFTARNQGNTHTHTRAALLDYFTRNPGTTLTEYGRVVGRSRTAVLEMCRRLVRMGLMERTGGSTSNARYVPSQKWAAEPTTKMDFSR